MSILDFVSVCGPASSADLQQVFKRAEQGHFHYTDVTPQSLETLLLEDIQEVPQGALTYAEAKVVVHNNPVRLVKFGVGDGLYGTNTYSGERGYLGLLVKVGAKAKLLLPIESPMPAVGEGTRIEDFRKVN